MDAHADRLSLVMSANRALLGEVSCGVRAVLIKADANAIYLRAIFDGAISEDDRGSISVVGSEVAADFDAFQVFDDCVRIDKPGAVPVEPDWNLVFLRKE
jgi:hypothetical protein